MTEQLAIKAAEYFRREEYGTEIVPIQVTFVSPSRRNCAVVYGVQYQRHNSGDTWLYLLTNVDVIRNVYKRKHYYEHDGADMYITGYTGDRALEPPFSVYHPFGHNVGMAYWLCGGPIDFNEGRHILHDRYHYPRVQMTIKQIQ